MAQTNLKFFDFCAGIGSAHFAFAGLGFDDKYATLAQTNFTQSKILSLAGNAMTVGVMQGIGREIVEGLNQKIVIARSA